MGPDWILGSDCDLWLDGVVILQKDRSPGVGSPSGPGVTGGGCGQQGVAGWSWSGRTLLLSLML